MTTDELQGSSGKKYLRLVIGVGLCGLIFTWIAFDRYSSPMDLLQSIVIGHSTVYADGFRQGKFRSVKPGMSKAEVEAIMGAPLQKGLWGGFPDVWKYTNQETVTDNFFRKWVIFENEKVSSLLDDFWVD